MDIIPSEQIQQGIDELAPWFYAFDFGNGVRTRPQIPPEVVGIHDTRLTMLEAAVASHFGARAKGLDCLDIGCHEGFYSLAMAKHGMRVTGLDAREENLRRARFVADAMGRGERSVQAGARGNAGGR